MNCEYASSEDAARHLLHLSASARNQNPNAPQDASPTPAYYGQQQQRQQHPQHQQQQPTAQPSIPVATPDRMVFPSAASNMQTNIPWRQDGPSLTSEAIREASNTNAFHQQFPNENQVDPAKLPFSDFLRDVLYDQCMGDNTRFADAQGLAVLDVCDDTNLELNDIDFGLLDHWNVDGMSDRDPNAPELQSSVEEPGAEMDKMRQRLVQIWTKSPWRWNPEKTDNAFRDQTHLPLPSNDIGGDQVHEYFDRVVNEKLHSAGRDKILAIVLGTCRNDSILSRVAASFPSTEVMDSWTHIFLASHLCQVSTFIHYPSFSLNSQWPEWLAIAASAGAVLAPVPTLRRFGFALQEAVRKLRHSMTRRGPKLFG